MTAINHSLTGALIGLTVADPFIALPLAFASHFVLDSLPHFGANRPNFMTTKHFNIMLAVDIALCFGLAILLAAAKPIHWPIAVICAFLAASPDFGHINVYYKTLKNLPWKPNAYTKFASKIQWFERPIGAVVEAFWLGGIIVCLSVFIPK